MAGLLVLTSTAWLAGCDRAPADRALPDRALPDRALPAGAPKDRPTDPAGAPEPATSHAPPPALALYGFAPFGPFEDNPTAALVQRLAASHADWSATVLEVEPADTCAALFDLLDGPARLVVGIGVRVGVPNLELNTTAINWLAMRSEADALHFGPIDPGLPTELSLDVDWQRTVIGAFEQAAARYALSDDAGMHACNLALFQSIAHVPPDKRTLFIHVGPNILERPDVQARLEAALEGLLRGLAAAAGSLEPSGTSRAE